MRRVKLSRLETVLEDLEYPISRDRASTELEDVTLLLADGETNLGAVVSETGSESFDSVDGLVSEIYGGLPIEAVGEPFQSEGEG
ncbi:DUF5789 family protein [Natrialbaceae archaeon A-gly3]